MAFILKLDLDMVMKDHHTKNEISTSTTSKLSQNIRTDTHTRTHTHIHTRTQTIRKYYLYRIRGRQQLNASNQKN